MGTKARFYMEVVGKHIEEEFAFEEELTDAMLEEEWYDWMWENVEDWGWERLDDDYEIEDWEWL